MEPGISLRSSYWSFFRSGGSGGREASERGIMKECPLMAGHSFKHVRMAETSGGFERGTEHLRARGRLAVVIYNKI